MSKFIKVYTGNFIDVQRILNQLQNSDIYAILKDESESARLAGFGSSILGFQEIHVHKDELDKAVVIIESIK